MGSTAAAAYFQITPALELEDLFLYFSAKLGNLPMPRSLVEAEFSNAEIDGLREWFVERWEVAIWCEDRLRLEKAANANRQEMIGALVLILASAQCRDHADEDAVWPTVTRAFKGCKGYPALFVAGQPTVAFKKAMAAGVRRLGLRNLIDRHGKQEYFDTLKLQFGFTRQGARRRLAEWLGGLAPLTVKILSADDPQYVDLKSESFIALWKMLKRFRDNRIAKEYARLVLQASPWVRPDWVEDLLEAAAKGRATGSPGVERPTEAAAAVADATDEVEHKAGVSEWLCEPILEWPLDARPRLVLRLSEGRMSDLLIDCTGVELSIDSKTVDRWSLLEAGDWRGKRELACPDVGSKLNLRPKLLLVRTHEGRIVKEFDLHEIGLGEPVLIFDLSSGRLVDAGNKFDPTREYAVICDSDLSVHGASRPFPVLGGRAYRTGRPWGEDFKITYGESVYWSPRTGERRSAAPLRLSMEFCEGPPVEIGSAAPILIAGAPSDAESVSLRLGNFSYDLSREGEAWRTDRAVPVSAKLAVGEEVARVRVTGSDYNRSATPTLRLNLRGIVRQESARDGELLWDLVKLDRPLERADGIGKARVFAGALDTPLFEGFRQIGRTSARGLDMSHLYGWGYSLGTGRERPLVETVEDRGRLKFFPSSFRGRTKDFVVWRIPTFPREGHRIVVWSDWAAQPREIDARQVVCDKDGLVWTLPLLGGVAAGAIAHNGLRLGSWFGAEAVATIGNVSALERHFAILRWLKVPVLSNAIVRAVREGICRDPAAFIRGWLDKGALPRGLVHGNGEDGLESVVREFFWYYSERSVSKVEALVAAFPAASYRNESGIEVFTSVLAGLSDEYPSIAYSLARVRVGGEYRRALRPVVEGLVFQPEPMPLAQAVRSASDRCAKLVGAAERQLEDAVVAFVACLDGRGNPTQAQNFYLRRLGETVNGRRFLSAALLLRLLEGRVP